MAFQAIGVAVGVAAAGVALWVAVGFPGDRRRAWAGCCRFIFVGLSAADKAMVHAIFCMLLFDFPSSDPCRLKPAFGPLLQVNC
ncbi:hypothetical protein M1L60_02895 [Actinoplanes sp. TRM 88003]|uniref:Uncharacterized protein n=1 Tax=Paractinoplanes aksuensis TaxID=2939490 RepID=A0ABT1DFF9_9ACTN|nr:hypothetical protein [Actinoplanes aksuensis]MCO8269535.1 hypothetical protein [Actinoplanes aksuensis]